MASSESEPCTVIRRLAGIVREAITITEDAILHATLALTRDGRR